MSNTATVTPDTGLLGLGEPNLDLVYFPDERASRDLLIAWMACGSEPTLPLAWFLSEDACARVMQESSDPAPIDFDASDEAVASLPGLYGRDVYDARLSRNALARCLAVLSDDVQLDAASIWEKSYLQRIYPYSAKSSWTVSQLAAFTRREALDMVAEIESGTMYPARSTAGEMILYFALEDHINRLREAGVGVPMCPLVDLMLEDLDFLWLFEPRAAGIEESVVAQMTGMTITGPTRWFVQFA